MVPLNRYLAFLRGINVGGHTLKMNELRTLLTDLGFKNVETFIASGNVIFESEKEDSLALEGEIEQRLKQFLGYEVVTFIRTPAELAAIVAYQPFPASDLALEGSAFNIIFLAAATNHETRQKLEALSTAQDQFHCHEREIYYYCRTKISQSPLFSGTQLIRAIGQPSTMRNANTVRKLADRYAVG